MKYAVNAKSCPDALGSASKGTTAGRLVFVSAQLPTDSCGSLVGATVKDQAGIVLDRIESILAEVGLDLSDVAKTTLYLTDLDDLEAFGEVYSERIDPPMPARSVVCAAELPFGALVQMDAVACR